jgi:transcriptional regulator with XRE-family HTH domain
MKSGGVLGREVGHVVVAPDGTAAALLTPAICLQARKLLGWSIVRLSAESGISTTTLRRIEAGSTVGVHVLGALRTTFEGAGIEFRCAGTDAAAVRLKAE